MLIEGPAEVCFVIIILITEGIKHSIVPYNQDRRQLFQVGAAPQSAGYCLGLRMQSLKRTIHRSALTEGPRRESNMIAKAFESST